MAGRIVVGVDRSSHSRRALQYAVEVARSRGARLEMVYAYSRPSSGTAAVYGATLPGPSPEQLERDALEVINHTVGVAPTDIA